MRRAGSLLRNEASYESSSYGNAEAEKCKDYSSSSCYALRWEESVMLLKTQAWRIWGLSPNKQLSTTSSGMATRP